MKALAATFLALIALFCGGCSLFFVVMGGSQIMDFALFWIPGLAIAALCIWGLRRMYPRSAPTPPTAPEDQQSAGNTPDQPPNNPRRPSRRA